MENLLFLPPSGHQLLCYAGFDPLLIKSPITWASHSSLPYCHRRYDHLSPQVMEPGEKILISKGNPTLPRNLVSTTCMQEERISYFNPDQHRGLVRAFHKGKCGGTVVCKMGEHRRDFQRLHSMLVVLKPYRGKGPLPQNLSQRSIHSNDGILASEEITFPILGWGSCIRPEFIAQRRYLGTLESIGIMFSMPEQYYFRDHGVKIENKKAEK
nr:N-alpha-acetyltransferase MAK3 [Ipomoea batatas]